MEQQIKTVGSICKLVVKEMSELEFPAYGSLYVSDAPFLDHKERTKLGQDPRYCIGPHCGARYWDCNVGEPRYYEFAQPNRGPCINYFQCLSAKGTSTC
jgi:hypothetical protein